MIVWRDVQNRIVERRRIGGIRVTKHRCSLIKASYLVLHCVDSNNIIVLYWSIYIYSKSETLNSKSDRGAGLL